MSASLIYDFNGLTGLQGRIARLEGDKPELLDIIGAVVESQVRRRIRDEKNDPDGTPWGKWSERYAKRRPAGRTLLMGEDHLLDTITHLNVDRDSLEVGSNMIYAATHQFGDDERNIPARPFLGISDDNETDLIREIDAYLDERIGR